MRHSALSTCLAAALSAAAPCGQIASGAAEKPPARPNIVLIMADDMGYSDIGCYGGEIRTPALDALARDGIRFSQFYNTARCCPTRASLLTGLHPHQAGIGHMTHQHGYMRDRPAAIPAAYQGWLNDRCVTIAEVLREAGYRNYMAGKWHVGTLDKTTWPLARGFDRYYGIINGASNYFHPSPGSHLTRDEETVEPEGGDYYTTDAFASNAISFLDRHAREHAGQPFFLYLAFTCPHWPLQAWPEDIAKYRGAYSIGWDELRRRRYERQQELGLFPAEWPLSERDPDVPAWDELGEGKKDEFDYLMAIYAAMVDRMDQNIGRVTQALKEHGFFENTLILFLSDNGACAEGGPLGQYTPAQLGGREGGGPPKYGACWANASNTPFRRYKHWVHEGGMGAPLIAHWPQGISAGRRGAVTQQYAYLPDIMATLVEAAGAQYPERFGDRDILPLEGRSFAHLLRGEERPVHEEPIFWEHEGNRAVRKGKWKLVALNHRPWELYDIDADRTETRNLANEKPALVRELSDAWEAWAERCEVEEWGAIQRLMRESEAQKKDG